MELIGTITGEIVEASDTPEYWAERINNKWDAVVRSAVDIGKDLIEAKVRVGHGNFRKLLPLLHFNKDKAALFMRLAQHEWFLNVSNIIHLPDSYVTQGQLAKYKPAELDAMVEQGVVHSGMTAKDLSNYQRKLKHDDMCEAEPMEGTYQVIYADPPWDYGDKRDITTGYSGAEDHYPSMTIEELCALPVESITGENAVLFMWTTSPLLFECYPIVEAWGFKYKTSFIWDKVKHNVGHYNSVRHEILLVCTKGSCTPDEKRLFDSVVTIERSDKHSEKPEEFRSIIDTLYHGKKIELFRRGDAPAGWSIWGNQASD